MKKTSTTSLLALSLVSALISAGGVLAGETTKVEKSATAITTDSESAEGLKTDSQSVHVQPSSRPRQKAGSIGSSIGKDAAGDAAGNPDSPRGLPEGGASNP